MGSPERTRSSVKRDTEDNNLDLKSDRARDKEESEGSDTRKHRSSRSKRSGNGEEAEGVESRGRKRSSGDRNENRKRSSGSSKTGSDEDDYEVKKESRSKMKKKQEESALDKLSNWYQDGEAENKSGNKGHVQNVEKERVKSNSKLSDHESSQTRSKGKDERSHGREPGQERDFTRSERRESSREKGQERDSRSVRRESSREKRHGSSDPKHETSKERSLTPKTELTESKIRVLDSNSAKCTKSSDKEERMVGSEKSKARSEAPEEGKKETPLIHEYILGKEKLEEQRLQASPVGLDVPENRERPLNTERSNRSGSPERSGRRHHESEYFEMDYERSSNFRRDDRFKGRDDSWSDRNRDREDSRDNWKRRQPNFPNKDAKDVDTVYDHGRDWELQRRGRERFDNERPQGRLGGRRDGNRTEVLKTSFESNYGISNDNYDVIEIQTNQEEHAYPRDNRANFFDSYGSGGQSGEDSKDRFIDDRSDSRDQNSWRDEKARSQKGATPNRATGGPSSSSGSQTTHGNQEVGPFNRCGPPGNRGNRFGRGGGRGRHAGRDSQPVAMPMPMVASPFGPLGMPPLTPTMSPGPGPGPGPPISPGVFIPPFPPVVWPGPRSVDMNLLAVQPGISTVPPGPSGPCFSPNIGTPSNPAMFFNQPGMGRGGPPNISGPSFNAMMPLPPGRGQPQEKTTGGGWVPSRSGPHGKAPSRGEQNDYSQNFVDTGMRPQNYIRELELTNVVEDYPKLRELIQRKDEIVTKASTAPMYYKCDLREHVLSSEFFGTKFDVILVDPPWEEYVHRAPGVTDHMEYWTFEEIMNLKIEAIADTPSFIFLWVGDGVGLEQGRQCLKKWGFRRCEDICWVKTNKTTATPGLRHDSHTLFQRSKEHCLMGIKGTVRRSTDGHIIHANIDTDVIIAEEPPYGSTAKPEDMYRIVEHFCLGRRRLELFGEDHNIRAGWLTVGKDLSSSNFNSEAYIRDFSDKDGKVWQGGGGRNPPPEAGHLILTTPEIESLRPKSPMKNQQQMQQQQQSSTIIAVTTTNSATKWAGNSPAPSMNQEASSSNNSIQFPWASSQMEGFKGGNNMGSDDRAFDMYGYNVPPFSQAGGDYLDYESHRVMNHNNNNNNNMSQ